MDLKWILLVAFVLAVMVNHQVQADFRPWPTSEELETKGLKCAPGRTVIKLEEKKVEAKVFDSGDEEDDFTRDGLRSHMNTNMHEEYCKVCVCSAAGKDEYCSGRPAANVNECIRMSKIMEQFTKNEPYDHTRLLSQRIRRDYIWHNDEIPYEAKAKCRRGHSYYSNSLTANDTDIDVASDVESLLDYSNRTICFYCVCSPSGWGVGCIPRQPWSCEYFRKLRDEDHSREVYKKLFQQDRPAYFRQLSWRLRRTMDDGLYDFTTAVGGGVTNKGESCVPFVSEYTDCNGDNLCSGCIKCVCALGGNWSCVKVHKCRDEDVEEIDMQAIDTAMNEIQNSMENYNKNEAATSKTPLVPGPPTSDQDLLLGNFGFDMNLDAHIASLLRNKRAVGGANSTKGIKFYHTVDEINEDTLKHGNLSGTLQAHKVNVVKTPKISRRTGLFNPNGNDTQSSLHIAYSEPKVYDPHIADNKIEARHDEHYNKLSLKKVQAVVGNHTQKQKDKDLSKLVVNELKPGAEIIGDKESKIMSNITFTPENDTLTAMAFIAGNLLNKLWNMEKESGEDSMETEVLKHEKIANLIDLFKEPLNLRQENFLKSALEQLSEAIDKNKIVKNVSLCEKLAETKNVLRAAQGSSEDTTTEKEMSTTESSKEKDFEVVTEAISKINNVLSLINKFQNVQNNLNDLKKKSMENNEKLNRKAFDEHEKTAKNNLTQDEAASLNVFGNVLDKITKLLLPPKKSKKMSKSIKNLNVLRNPKDVSKKIKDLYNIDVDSSNLSPKDQLIVDYLSAIKRNPKCILDNFRANDQTSMAKIQGDILLNLSEFFKVKSFMDLMKLVRPEADELSMRSHDDKTTKIPEITTETTTSTIPTATEASNKLKATKDRLKAHLKTIIDDLVELQTASGSTSKNISIADALPCIYKMLNADKSKQYEALDNRATTVPPVRKVAEIFNTLKEELVSTSNRRSGTYSGVRPRSATVWERLIKNLDTINNHQTRRNLEVKEPKSFEELKKLMDESESGSKTYKNQALINGVPPSERLILLKTLSADVKQYIEVLEEIGNSMSNLEKITVEEKTDLRDFIDNAATNINLDDNIAKNINKLKVKKYQNFSENRPQLVKKPRANYVQMQSMKRLDVNPPEERNDVKLSRDAIVNQLIKNRMQLYVKLKEAENDDLENDLNYSIAKSILTYLELGNSTVARELYKMIVSHKQKKVESTYLRAVKPTKPSSFGKLPVVQFEEPRGQNQLQWLNQEAWLKQLSNLKNMKA